MRSLAVTLAGVLIGLAACGSTGAEKPAEGLELGLTVSTQNNPYFLQFRDGAEAAAENFGVKLDVADAANDPAKQASQIRGFTSRHLDAIIINPVASDGLTQAVNAATQARIPVIAADRSIAADDVTQTITSDNLTGGKLGAQELARQIGGKGKVVTLQGTAGTSAARERGEGFLKGIAAYPKVEVVARERADFSRAKGQEVMANLLRKHPDITGVFAHNDEMALGAVQALGPRAGTKAGQVKVVGFDGTPQGIKAVRAGTMAATVAQQPRLLGWHAVDNAIKAARGQTVARTVKVPVKVATKENANEFWTF